MMWRATSARPYDEKFELEELVRGRGRLEPLLGHLEVGHARRGSHEHMRRQKGVVAGRHQGDLRSGIGGQSSGRASGDLAGGSCRTSTQTEIGTRLTQVPSGGHVTKKHTFLYVMKIFT